MITKFVLYIKEIKKCFPLQRKYCNPLVQFESYYHKKLFFLSNNKFIEVLYCVQFTAMVLLF